MNINLNPNEYPAHQCLARDTVSTDAIECIELVTINVTKNTPRRLLTLYVVRDAELHYGVLDAAGVGGPHTSTREILWFDVTSVEECIAAFQDFLTDAQSAVERITL